ncbi:MAG: prepilin-type N-terminal cleavage/methylation domain-containing protein [Planctomycetota bacterium]|jgi:prepilin-type N-terminal cleavage/methylation domain-containing protein
MISEQQGDEYGKAFTLIELLVVIIVIVVLMGVLILYTTPIRTTWFSRLNHPQF